MNDDEIKAGVSKNFDLIARCYNHSALRFFPFCADRLVRIIKPDTNAKILDVATGTGVVAISMAQAVKAAGRVQAIDLSEKMLAQAEESARKMGLNNIDFFEMDAESLDFKSNYFDVVTCSFGLFFMPNMLAALREWRRVTKPKGLILFTSFAEKSFQPMIEYFISDMLEFGYEIDGSTFAAIRLRDPDICVGLMQDAGLTQVTLEEIQVGYHLRDADEWWQVLWNSGFRRHLLTLPENKIEEFRQLHQNRINTLVTDKGIWMDVLVQVTTGRV